jgi:cytochrome c peroxidase
MTMALLVVTMLHAGRATEASPPPLGLPPIPVPVDNPQTPEKTALGDRLLNGNRFHNIGVGINRIQDDVPKLAKEYLWAEATAAEVDIEALAEARSSELGRFAVTTRVDEVEAFKTPRLRNVAQTAPFMHDGGLKTSREVLVHHHNGGVTNEGDAVNDFLSGGIRPLGLSDGEIDDLVTFMESLTSPEFADASIGE